MDFVIGADVWKGRWVGAGLDADGIRWIRSFDTFAALLREDRDNSTVIGVDIPIGLPENGRRECDLEGRQRLGRRRATLFLTPPRPVLTAATYAEARRTAVALTGHSVSAQSFALRSKILEVEPFAAADARIHEVHPELAFASMSGAPLASAKTTWTGQMERRRLLAAEGLRIADDVGAAGAAAPDDIIDAVAVAWTARRIAAGIAERIPPSGSGPAIWS